MPDPNRYDLNRMRVSVVVPTYNHASFVEECLTAIRDQSRPPDEVVVIDDGSTDATWELVKNFPFPSTITTVRKQTTNQGAHAALNFGMDLATGDYVALCNSDDAFDHKRLETMLAAMDRTGAEFAFSRCCYVDDHGTDVTMTLPYATDLWQKQNAISTFATVGYSLLHTNVAISTGNFVMRKSRQKSLGYFRPYRYVHDWDYVLRAVLQTEPLFGDKTLYRYRIHQNNSVASLAHVAGIECPELMRRYMKAALAQAPENRQAPSPHRWPVYFDIQTQRLGLAAYMVGHDSIDAPAFLPPVGMHGHIGSAQQPNEGN